MSDPIVGTETWSVRFSGGTSTEVRVDHHRGGKGDWHYAWALWPGITTRLHLAGNTARYAVERLVACGISNADNDEEGCGLREVLSPADLRAEAEQRKATVELAYGPDDPGPDPGMWTLKVGDAWTFETEFCIDPALSGTYVRCFARNEHPRLGADGKGRTVGEALAACGRELSEKYGVPVVPVRRAVRP